MKKMLSDDGNLDTGCFHYLFTTVVLFLIIFMCSIALGKWIRVCMCCIGIQVLSIFAILTFDAYFHVLLRQENGFNYA